MQGDDIAVSDTAITGTLKYLSSGALATDWGAGYFMALKFSNIDKRLRSVKVGLTPSEGSGLVELDSDLNGVFKVTDKATQKFTVQISDGRGKQTKYYDLSGLTLQGGA